MLKLFLKNKIAISLLLVIVMLISTLNYPVKAYDMLQKGSFEYSIGEKICICDEYGCKVLFCLESSWASGYNATITIENNTDSPIQNWKLSLKSTDKITNIWNAEIKVKSVSEYIIGNAGWNRNILPGQQVSFGYTSDGIFEELPSAMLENIEFSSVADKDYMIDYIINSDWGDGFSSTISIKNISGKPIECWSLSFMFDRDIIDIWNAVIVEKNENLYTIKCADYNSVIQPGQTVEFGFNGNKGTADNIPSDYVLSSCLPTDDVMNDTESEFIELPDGKIDRKYIVNAILPSLYLSGDDRTEILLSDDYDLDGLTLEQEYEFDTNPFCTDTDEDGLSDYDELFVYGTDPIHRDTDRDGMSDGTEIECGLNPNIVDTDEDGIWDAEELTTQNVRLNLNTKYTVVNVGTVPSISISGTGDYSGKFFVEPILDNKTITGLDCIVGTAYDFKHEDTLTFKESTLSFSLGEQILSEHKAEDLSIAYYDTSTNTLIPLETVVSSPDVISAKVDHYCIFLVIDTLRYLNDTDYLYSGYAMESGRTDIVFVIDTTGSMSGMIREVRDNIENFVDELSDENIDIRLGLVEYRDIEEDGYNSTKSHGWFDDVETFKNELRKLGIDGGGDTPESAVDGLFCAAGMKYRKGVHKHLILVTDADSKNGTREDKNKTLKDARDELYGRNIKVHAYVPKGYGSDYRDLFDTDSSRLVFTENGFTAVKDAVVEEISEESDSGCWVRLSDGSVVFLEQDPELGDETIDTDRDGIPDIYELGEKSIVSVFNNNIHANITIESWTYYSNPVIPDTDGDGIEDGYDFFPNEYDAVIIKSDENAIIFNSGRVWNVIPCTTSEYLENVVFYKNAVTISEGTYVKAIGRCTYNNKVNGDYSLDELCLVALINPDGIPTYADDMIGKVASAERTEIIEKILNRDMKYYRHETEERWVLISDGDYEGGFFKGAVLSEADMNLTFKPYQVIDINWVQDIVVRTAEIVTLAYLFAASAAVVTENLAAFIGYVKLYGFSAGLKWYMQLGTSGFPDGALSWLIDNHMSSQEVVWTGHDKYVPELANAIESKYPGRVVAVEKIIKDADGRTLTDFDIELDTIIIQVKSGSAKGLTSQMIRTAEISGKTVISFTPDIYYNSAVLQSVRRNGFETFIDVKEIIDYISNH